MNIKLRSKFNSGFNFQVNMTNLKKYFPTILIFITLLIIYSHRLTSSFNFHPDFTRDIYDMLTIIQGKFSLIGPKSSFGGMYTGPYYYYLFMPIFYLTKLNVYSLLIFNLALFLFALIFFNLHVAKKYGVLSASLSTLVIGLSPIYISASRGPWNASTYIPFLLVFLTLLYFNDFNNKKVGLLFLGLLGGIIATIHLVNIAVLLIVITHFFYTLKRKRNILYFFIGLLLAFSPLIVFELKHNFIMFRNTFIVGSYKSFINNRNLFKNEGPDTLKSVAYIVQNLSSQLGVNFLLLTFLFIGLWRNLKENKDRFFIISSALLTFVFILLSRYQFVPFYLFPLSVLVLFTSSLTILNTNYKWLLVIILLVEMYSFPGSIYTVATRKPEQYERVVNFVLSNKILKKDRTFNVIEISKDYGAKYPIGYGYRFFFRKYGHIPKSEFEYNTSDTLLILSEARDVDILKLNSWEMNQFGKRYIQNRKLYEIGKTTLYVLSSVPR